MGSEFFEIDDFNGPFIKRLKDNVIRTGDHVMLCRDPETGLYWQIDEWDKYGIQLAIRINDPDNWDRFDDTEVRVEFLVESRGGLDQGKCQWEGCERKRLKGMVFCPFCALKKMGVDK